VSPPVPVVVVPPVPVVVVPPVPVVVVPPVPVVPGTMRRGLLVQAPTLAMTKQDMTISVLFMETFS
jgi:hypothetical protein